ncbi:MAG: hypothetical protein WCV82_04000 [Candidatus Paceibacterota bacterium]
MNSLRQWYSSCAAFLRAREPFQIFLAAALFFAVFFSVYFSVSTISSSDDHFFHLRFAQEMLNNGFFDSFRDFHSIYFSNIAQGNAYFVYYNFLFYLFILPFTFVAPLYLGIKLYAVFAVTAAFTLLYFCLKRFEIKNPFVWTLLFIAITNVSSIWRFFLSRPYSLAPSLLLLLLFFLYRKNHLGVFLVSAIYMFWHSATFFMPLGVAVVYYLVERFYGSRGDIKNLLYAFFGTALAVLSTYLVSSGFLLYMKEIIFGTYLETIIGKKVAIGEGGELYPADFFNLIQANSLIFALFVTALSVDIYSYVSYRFRQAGVGAAEYFAGLSEARRHLQTSVLIMTAGFFLGTIVMSSRFGDYFTFFAALYIALCFDYVRRLMSVSGNAMIRRSMATGLAIVLVYLFVSNMLFLQNRLAYGTNPNELLQVGMWLKENTKPGTIVFNANWSWFPQLYYNSPNNNYVTGLEPRFTYTYDPKIYWLWAHIAANGYVCEAEKCLEIAALQTEALAKDATIAAWAKIEGEKIADAMLDKLHSPYVVTSRDYRILNYTMDHSDRFKRELYNEQYGYLVYSVKPK